MAGLEEIWVPLVDEPIGTIVERIQRENPEIDELVNSPHRILAFRTFAYIRVGVVLGELLVEHDITTGESDTWVEALLNEPAHRAVVAREVRAIAEEVGNDPDYADDEPLGPDEDTRERFRAFARERLS